jgi:hypothetical protein
MKKHYRHENDCLNCGTDLQGKFCHNCGQENLQIKESFGHMLNHAVSDYFHFDHQFFHTLKPLLMKPGKLTVEYMNGRRAQYLHPVKMYIFISLVFFVLLFKSNHEIVKINNGKKGVKNEIANEVKKNINNDNSLSDAEKKKLTGQVNKLASSDKTVAIVKKDVPGKMSNAKNDIRSDDEDSTLAQYNLNQKKLPANERDGFWQRLYTEKKLVYTEKYGKEKAMEHYLEDLRHNIPKMMFVLLPLFAVILRLAFWKNKKYYVEHLIYAIHLHCFIFLFYTIILLIQMLLPKTWSTLDEWLTTGLWIYTIYYIYRSLRVVYQRTRWRTISKMFGMSIMYWVAFVICIFGLAMATAFSA